MVHSILQVREKKENEIYESLLIEGFFTPGYSCSRQKTLGHIKKIVSQLSPNPK